MTLRRVLPLASCLLSFLCSAKAAVISTFTYQFTSADATESGRPSRSSIPQDWTGTEIYTGTLAGTYFYKTFTLPASLFARTPYVDVSALDPTNGSSYFVVAYANAYDVNSRATNWLGDAGFGGNGQVNAGSYFQVVLKPGADLVLVLNSTASNVLPTYPFTLQVGAYADTEYSEPTPVPEPSSWMMVGSAALGGLGFARRRLAV